MRHSKADSNQDFVDSRESMPVAYDYKAPILYCMNWKNI